MNDLYKIADQFDFPAAVSTVRPFGSGLINETFVVTFKDPPGSDNPRLGKRAILQSINSNVFPEPDLIMRNLTTVLDYAATKSGTGSSSRDIILPPVYKTRQGTAIFEDDEGKSWRALGFIENSTTFDVLQNSSQAREAGRALGAFHQLLSDIPVDKLHDTLPGFHDTPVYLAQFDATLAQAGLQTEGTELESNSRFQNLTQRMASRDYCLEQIEKNRDLAGVIYNANPPITLHVTHGDPKLNNFLFDQHSGEAVSIIDLDTIKAGYIHYDLGDCIRSTCNSSGEMPARIDDVKFELDHFQAILQGYLSTAAGLLDIQDFELLYDLVRLLPFELGIRFFTDYLNGNRYFKVTSADDNLYRARVQFELLNSIETQAQKIRKVISEYS